VDVGEVEDVAVQVGLDRSESVVGQELDKERASMRYARRALLYSLSVFLKEETDKTEHIYPLSPPSHKKHTRKRQLACPLALLKKHPDRRQ